MTNPDAPLSLEGRFIVLDGPDGCGKSTQARLLTDWLSGQGVPAVMLRDPGDTAIGENIRDILLSVEHATMCTPTEVMLYMASRAQLWAERIAPALDQGKCVVLDRWLSATCAYQGYAGGFGAERVAQIATDTLERVWPDLTIVLDVNLETAAGRLRRELDRMEQKGDAYHNEVHDGFLKLAEGRDDFAVVDASEDIQAVHGKVIEQIRGHFALR